ncbi:MAG: NADPH-dependent assimilatory sulfite reductase hemoprotein subunit [Planctomycetales bacterium]
MTEDTKEIKLSPIEGLKSESHQLRGTILEELLGPEIKVSENSANLMKHHGTYQQDDRDHRGDKNDDGTTKERAYQFMVRTRIPGGRIEASTLLKELDLCDKYANGTLRITTRQGLQLHGVLKQNLRQAIREINQTELTTLAACGDVNRNVMCCPAPLRKDPVRDAMQKLSQEIAEHFKPRTTAYREIWLTDENGEKTDVSEFHPVEEPIYGPNYLPRKFKMAIGLPDDNCVDVYTNDLGLLAVAEHGKIIGYEVLVGGGMGVTPSAKKTFPALAKHLTFVTPDKVVGVAEAIVKVQRDFGNRSDRKVARLKYLIHNIGLEAFKEKVEEYCGSPLPPPRNVQVTGVDDHLGWHEQGDGKWFLGINVENGRIKDEGKLRIKTGLRVLLGKYPRQVRLTPLQSLIVCDIADSERTDINKILLDHGIQPVEKLSLLRRYSIACPAWPTCGLSITESERALPSILDEMEQELGKFNLSNERISVHMTGCPNGCARPYTPDIGFVGKAAGEKYTIYLGGNVEGTRLGFIYADMIEKQNLVPTLSPLFRFYSQHSEGNESFGDFCHRQGKEALEAFAQKP